MKLVSLNAWGGTLYEPFKEFVHTQAKSTDVFCFQELFSALPGAPLKSSGARMFLLEELKEMLADFVSLYDIRSTGFDFAGPVDFPVSHGLGIFVKNNLKVKHVGSHLIGFVEHQTDHLLKAQVAQLHSSNGDFSVVNFHGIAQPGDKMDTPERLEQSKKLALVWKALATEAKILCGDFNLYPQTQSVKILDEIAVNLIKEWKITNTRNEISWQLYGNSKQNFADYTFVSNHVKVKDFSVPYNEISDHLPMILEFEI